MKSNITMQFSDGTGSLFPVKKQFLETHVICSFWKLLMERSNWSILHACSFIWYWLQMTSDDCDHPIGAGDLWLPIGNSNSLSAGQFGEELYQVLIFYGIWVLLMAIQVALLILVCNYSGSKLRVSLLFRYLGVDGWWILKHSQHIYHQPLVNNIINIKNSTWRCQANHYMHSGLIAPGLVPYMAMNLKGGLQELYNL